MKQKKFFLFLICILSGLNINAEIYSGSCGTNARYTLNTSTGVLSITGTGAMTDYYYPATIGTPPWSSQQSYIKTIEIADGITSIGNRAFHSCSGMTSVTIPNSVTSIGEYSFYGCKGLTSIFIPNSVNSIKFDAFGNCSGLTSITIPNSVTSIGTAAFHGCYFEKQNFINNSSLNAEDNNYWFANFVDSRDNGFAIKDGVLIKYFGNETSVTIPNSVTSIGNYAFQNCSSLSSVTIPNSVTSIENGAFHSCSSLTSVKIPNSVTSIGSAFSYCSNLISIEIPNSVTSIENYAFEGTAWYDNQPDDLIYAGKVAYKYKGTMPENTSISIKEGTTCITGAAFSACSGLKSISIPNSVTSIGNYAFQNCSSLSSVTIPNSVTSLGDFAFSGCPNLTNITINSDAVVSKTYSSSSAIKEIFGTQVTGIIIGNDVTSIGSYAFYGCTAVTSFEIPNSVTEIGKYSFNGCTNLTTISVGSNIQTIGERAFANIEKLSKFTCYSGVVPTTARTTFDNSYINYVELYVPSASVNAYKNKLPWSGFGSINALSDLPQCATPNIDYVDGELTFNCETEDVEFVYDITSSISGKGTNVTLPTKTTYIVTVYAKKEGYENSEVATKEIEVSGGSTAKKGDVNEDGNVNGTDIQEVINIIVEGE